MRNTFARLLVEAAFIVLVLVIARLADLSAGWIILCGAVAWLLTAIAEGYVSRGWQGAATFVPPVRPFAAPRAAREPAQAAPVWEPAVTPPERVAPGWLETAEMLGVHVAGFEAPEVEPEPVESEAVEPLEPEPVGEELPAVPAETAAEEESVVLAEAEVAPREEPAVAGEDAEEEAALPGEGAPDEERISPAAPARKPIRSRMPRRFVTQSGRPGAARPNVASHSVDEPPSGQDAPEVAAPAPPEAKPWPPPDRRWPWRRSRGEQEPDRGPAPQRRGEAQPELPLFELPERLCRSCGRPISNERLRAIPNATQCVDCKREGRPELADSPDFELASDTEAELVAPEMIEEVVVEVEVEPVTIAPEAELAPEPAAVSAEVAPEPPPVEPEAAVPPGPPSAFPDSAREWNVWELERLARRLGGRDAARDEEWGFLLVYLREFANPEGSLPADFDALVRESFPELIAVAETP